MQVTGEYVPLPTLSTPTSEGFGQAEYDAEQEGTAEDVLLGQTSSEPIIDAAAEKRLVRKLDWRILPVLCLLYLFACTCESRRTHYLPNVTSCFLRLSDLDRSNLGNARLQGLPEDALGGDPSGKLFAWVNSAFFFSYVSYHLFCDVLRGARCDGRIAIVL